MASTLNPVDLDNYITGHWGREQLRGNEPLRMSRTFGELPAREEFSALWEARDEAGELRGGRYHITLGRSDSEALERYQLGDGAYTESELYSALAEIVSDPEPWDLIDDPEGREMHRSYERHDEAMSFVSSILETLGMEWV